MRTLFLIITIFLFNGCSTQDQTNVCTFNLNNAKLPSTWSYATLDQVKLCFKNISINNAAANETMKQLFNSLDFYSFLSIVRQSNFPYYMNVNLREELVNIDNQFKANAYKSDYDFHMAITTSFKKLKDFHTTYFAPYGYAQFHVLLPFILEFMPSTKQIKVQYAIKLYSSVSENNLNMNYQDKIVTKIDGINALDYMKNFADNYSLISKDPSVRLNSVFREEFWLRNLAKYPLPSSNNITFTFFDTKETTVTFPYLMIITKQYTDKTQIENDNIFSPSLNYENKIALQYLTDKEQLNWYEVNKNNSFRFVMGSNGTYYYIHKNTNTSIIRLSSFADESVENIKNILLAANGTTLIIDVIGNNGGVSCLAYAVLNNLVPEYSSLNLLYEPLDGRITKPLITFSTIFSFFPDSILDLRTMSSFTTMEWIQPYINYTRGNITDEYSTKWSINCDGAVFGAGKYWVKNKNNTLHFKSIYVLTDGTCGSACSLFVSKLQYGSNFNKIYGLGGGYTSNYDLFESSSYAGGGAFNWNDIVTYYNQVSGGNTSINYLPTSAYLNLNVFEIYINELSQNYPREYLKQSIDKPLEIGDYFNIDQSLEKIIKDDNRSSGDQVVYHRSVQIFIFNVFVTMIFIN